MQSAEASLAADRALDTETIQRLARLDTHGPPVLSVYLDLDPGRFPTPDTRQTQLGALLDKARREGADRDADRIEAWLAADGAIRRGARGLAIFSSAQAGVFEAVRLAGPVEPLAVVDLVPWLEPLAAQISPGGLVGRSLPRGGSVLERDQRGPARRLTGNGRSPASA